MQDDDRSATERVFVSMRTMDIIVALLFLLASSIVIYDAVRLGFGWLEGEGPAPGYFPFRIGLIMASASTVNLVRALLRVEAGEGIPVTVGAFTRVFTALVPAILYVPLITGISLGPVEISRFSIFLAQVASILGLMFFVMVRGLLRAEPGGDGIFVTATAFRRVMTVLVPTLVYVALIGGVSFGWVVTIPQGMADVVGVSEVTIGIPRLGIYVASAIFIFGFMTFVGREKLLKAIGVGIVVPIALFFMFEKWFLVPLPKGPLEAWLGY